MTPLWLPCRRAREPVSHYLFNAPARAAQPHPGGVKLHFWPRSFPPGQFGEGLVMKGLSCKQHLSLCFFVLPPLSSFVSLYSVSPDAELCEPRQWEQPRNPCQGAQLWHRYPGKGEDPGCSVQEHAILTETTSYRHGPRWGLVSMSEIKLYKANVLLVCIMVVLEHSNVPLGHDLLQ